jgi:excisionase family DNA binding protein
VISASAPPSSVIRRSYDHLLTTSEVASLLRVSSRTVRLWAESLQLPGIKVGKRWRFRKTDITNVVTESTCQS